MRKNDPEWAVVKNYPGQDVYETGHLANAILILGRTRRPHAAGGARGDSGSRFVMRLIQVCDLKDLRELTKSDARTACA